VSVARIIAGRALLALALLPGVKANAYQIGLRELRLEQLLSAASARATEYFQLFRDLTAVETKTIERVADDGSISRRRVVVSDFVVYVSQVDGGSLTEFRDVLEVDGRPVANHQQRVLTLLGKQARAKSVREELRRMARESSRYDLDNTITGLTISEGLPLLPWARALFDFSVVGRDAVEGREVMVLAYQQAAPSARFGFNLSLPSRYRQSAPLYRGRLWIDALTAHLWREEREVTVTNRETGETVVVQQMSFEYGQSEHGLPLPRRIVFTSRTRFEEDAGGRDVSEPISRVTFRYGQFRRFTVSDEDLTVTEVEPAADGADAAAAQPIINGPAEPIVTVGDSSASSAEPAPGAVENDTPLSDPTLGPEFGPQPVRIQSVLGLPAMDDVPPGAAPVAPAAVPTPPPPADAAPGAETPAAKKKFRPPPS
jgi:hypothetical protein